MTFAEQIQKYRTQCELSRPQLARAINADPVTVWQWETGVCEPRRKALGLLIDFFETKLGDQFHAGDLLH